MISRTNIVLGVLLLVTILLAATASVDYSRPNIEILPDMKYSPASFPYSANPHLAGGRTQQAPVPGTIARGELTLHFGSSPEEAIRAGEQLVNPYAESKALIEASASEPLIEGRQGAAGDKDRAKPDTDGTNTTGASAKETASSERTAPPEVAKAADKSKEADADTNKAQPDGARKKEGQKKKEDPAANARRRVDASIGRGAEVFRYFCTSCHGPTGAGDGVVAQRGFPPPPSLITGKTLQMKDGQLFHILTYGQVNMPPFAAELAPDRRWDAINYVRGMQASAARKAAANPVAPDAKPAANATSPGASAGVAPPSESPKKPADAEAKETSGTEAKK